MSLVERACELATSLHVGQVRKGSEPPVPYITHPIEVMEIVRAHGGNEVEQAGALCHDTAEDQGGQETIERIRRELGDEVASIVVGCSDSLLPKGGDKPPWRERKEGYIAHLRAETSRSILLVSCADKLANARAIRRDLCDPRVGVAVWSRFKAGRDEQLWYYTSLSEVFLDLLPGALANELAAVVAAIGEESAVEFSQDSKASISLEDVTAILVEEGLDWDQTAGYRKFPAGDARRLNRKLYVALPSPGAAVTRIDLSGFTIAHDAFRPVGPRRDRVKGRIDCRLDPDLVLDAVGVTAKELTDDNSTPRVEGPDGEPEAEPAVSVPRQEIERWMAARLGYGRRQAKAWFLGMEESCHCADELDRRLAGDPVEDLDENLRRIGCYPELLEPEPNLQPTWRPLILAWLVATTGRVPTTSEIRQYQRRQWGRPTSDHLLVELMPLPAPSTTWWSWQTALGRDRREYTRISRPRRIDFLAAEWRRSDTLPRVAIAYGKGNWSHYRQIFDLTGDGEPIVPGMETWARGYRTRQGGVVLAHHPVGFGGSNTAWEAVGRWLKEMLASGGAERGGPTDA